jgi:hypothetical protein
MHTSPRTYPAESAAGLAGIPADRAAPTPNGRIARVSIFLGVFLTSKGISVNFSIYPGA